MNKPKTLQLEPEHKLELEKLLKSGMTPVIIAQRAKILMAKSEGKSNNQIADELGINTRTVLLWVNKYKNRSRDDSLSKLLNVSEGRGAKEEITGEAKT